MERKYDMGYVEHYMVMLLSTFHHFKENMFIYMYTIRANGKYIYCLLVLLYIPEIIIWLISPRTIY